MSRREDEHALDAELHLLRSVARSLEDLRARGDAEAARFALWAALEGADYHRARRWSRALRVALAAAPLLAHALAALDVIDTAIESAIASEVSP